MSNIFWVAGMLVAFAVVFQVLTGTPPVLGILGGATIVILYTTMGGMLAVAWTDFVQVIVIAFGLVVLLIIVLVDSGGWGNIAPHLPGNTFRLFPLADASGEVWLNYMRAWVIIGVADLSSQTMIGRALAAKSERVAVQSFYFGAAGYIAISMIPVMLGIIGSVTMPDLGNSESVVPALAIEHLHPAFLAIFVGAILAAIMSSCDSALLAVSSITSINLLPLVKQNPSERLKLLVVRWGIPVGGVIAIIIALNAEEVFNTMLDANLLILAAVIAPFILGLWWKKANRAGALAAMGMGIVSWLMTSLVYPDLPGDFIGLGVSLLTMLLVTPLTQRVSPPRSLHDTDGNPVELTDRLGLPW
jgi:Na+/proline symporter